MAKKSSTRSDYTQLKVLAEGLKKLDDGKFKVQIGIFGDKNSRPKDHKKNGPTNAEIGFIQEMGSVSRGIPRRSFLLDTFSFHGEELMKTLKPAVDKFFKQGKIDEYLAVVKVACVSLVVEAFQTSGWGSWAPNAHSTLLRKLGGSLGKRRQMTAEVMHEGAGHAKPLIDTGQLWHAIDARTVKS